MPIEFWSVEPCECGSHDRREEEYGYSRHHDYRRYETCVACGKLLVEEHDNSEAEAP